MTVLKWLVVLASVGYLGGLAVLYLKQRDFVFPIPRTVRTAPEAAGFPEAEEHVLTTADGEKVIIWHVPAKPDHPVVIYFPAMAIFWPGRSVGFGPSPLAGSASSRCPTVVMPARAASPARTDCCRMPRRLTLSLRRDTARSELSSGAFHSAPGLLSPSPRTTGCEADPGSSLYIAGGRRCFAFSDRAGTLAVAGSVPFRCAYDACHLAVADHARRK